MSATSVSVLVPLMGPSAELPSTIETIERYLQTTGFAFDIRVLDRRDGAGYGAMIRRGTADAGGRVIVIVDHDLPRAATMPGLFLQRGVELRSDSRQRGSRVQPLQVPIPRPLRSRR